MGELMGEQSGQEAMAAKLLVEVVGSTDAPAALPWQGRMVVGSDASKADLVVDGQGVDPVHCAIGRIKGGGWALRDLGSRFGTFVNGQRIETKRLEAGDAIILGSRRLRVFDPLNPDAVPAPAAQAQPAETPPAASIPQAAKAPQAAPKPQPAPAAKKPAKSQAPKAKKTGPRNAEDVHIKGYRVSKLLGRGGMGDVYLATQESLDRKVALKVLSPRLEADTEFVRRFQVEARTAAALNHPNVVTVYDVGEDGGHHYLSMEFMQHGCLESRVTETGPMPWREVLDALRDAASGLEFAEQKGIVHRDIKPANLMQNDLGQTKIADLGLAAQVEQEVVQGEKGKVFGTPHFLAPELIRGENPDARSDLYALGCTAYRLLTGHTPFEGSSTQEILRAALRDEPEPIQDFAPGCPEAVNDLVQHLLVKDPVERMPSASVLLKEIERVRSGGARQVAAVAAQGGKSTGLILAAAVVIIAGVLGIKALMDYVDPDETGHASGTGTQNGRGENPADEDPGIFGPGAGTPTDVDPGPPTEDVLRLAELEAGYAYMSLKTTELTDRERVDELRKFADKHNGTDWASKAREDADNLEAATTAELARLAAAAGARKVMLESLRTAAGFIGDAPVSNPRPGESLAAIAAVEGQVAFEGDQIFADALDALNEQVLDNALAFVATKQAEAESAAAKGDFSAFESALLAIIEVNDLPSYPAGREPFKITTLRAHAARAIEQRKDIPALRSAYAGERAESDIAAVASGLSGLEDELRTLSLGAAAKRLRNLASSIATEDTRVDLELFSEELDNAGATLANLGKAFGAGQWRRTSVNDPRGRRGSREAIGADERGITLSIDGDAQHVPWSAWGGDVHQLNSLLKGRLKREWTPHELRGISTLILIGAVQGTLDSASSVLTPGRGGRMTPSEVAQITAFFEVAKEWNFAPEQVATLKREQAAAEALARGLQDAGDEAWSAAVAALENIFDEHANSLLLRFLSDGSDWRE